MQISVWFPASLFFSIYPDEELLDHKVTLFFFFFFFGHAAQLVGFPDQELNVGHISESPES